MNPFKAVFGIGLFCGFLMGFSTFAVLAQVLH